MTGISGTSDMARILRMRTEILEQSQSLRSVAEPVAEPSPFASALAAANSTQIEAGAAAVAWERGETHDLAAVMVARQKSALAFEATLQVRNKLLSAYRDIMNMPV